MAAPFAIGSFMPPFGKQTARIGDGSFEKFARTFGELVFDKTLDMFDVSKVIHRASGLSIKS